MKRILLLFLVVSALCLLCACGDPSSESADPIDDGAGEDAAPVPVLVGVVVDTDNVNLRVAPSQEARIIDNVVAGTMMRVSSEEPKDGWYQVIVRGDTAYVYADFLYVSQWQSDDEVTLGTVLKDRDQVGLRSSPSTTAEVVTKAVRYQRFVVLQENVSENWYKVDYKGSELYLPAGSLKLETLCISDALL